MNQNTRTVLITGASSGIGLSTALLFLKKKWYVVCLAREQKSFDVIREKLGANISNIEFHAVDFTNPKSIDAFFQKKDFKFEYIDALVNSAGISSKTKIQNLTVEEWEKIFMVNVTCSFKMIKECIRYMNITRSPTVVNISSIAGRLRSISLSCAYSSSKAALFGMTRHMAMELSNHGIRVNCLAPGQTLTPMLKSALSKKGQEELAKKLPLKRLSSPEEQAKIIYFLSSTESSYINGAIIDSNGGAL